MKKKGFDMIWKEKLFKTFQKTKSKVVPWSLVKNKLLWSGFNYHIADYAAGRSPLHANKFIRGIDGPLHVVGWFLKQAKN